jgi:hypothetical protein
MTKLICALALLSTLAAGCGPAADSIPSAQAQPPVSAVFYPEISETAGDGQVYEYH